MYPFANLIFPVMLKFLALLHLVISQVPFALVCGFASSEVGLAEAAPHRHGMQPELLSAAETP